MLPWEESDGTDDRQGKVTKPPSQAGTIPLTSHDAVLSTMERLSQNTDTI
jgi:hypothetical protein